MNVMPWNSSANHRPNRTPWPDAVHSLPMETLLSGHIRLAARTPAKTVLRASFPLHTDANALLLSFVRLLGHIDAFDNMAIRISKAAAQSSATVHNHWKSRLTHCRTSPHPAPYSSPFPSSDEYQFCRQLRRPSWPSHPRPLATLDSGKECFDKLI